MTNSQRTEAKERKQASIEFELARAKAINEYADLEGNLAHLFETLLNSTPQKSFTVFSAILNTRARLNVLQDLLELCCGQKYQLFFTGLKSELEKIDAFRNKLVHWAVMTSHRGDKAFDPKKDVALHEHPNIFGRRKIYLLDIQEFKIKTRFYGLLLFYFTVMLKGGPLEVGLKKIPWETIFSERPRFPPQKGHPLEKILKR